jgi:hypothetical protein
VNRVRSFAGVKNALQDTFGALLVSEIDPLNSYKPTKSRG